MGFQCYIPCHAHAPRSVTILAVQFRQMHGAGEEHEERKPVAAQLSSLCVSFKCRGGSKKIWHETHTATQVVPCFRIERFVIIL